MTNEAAAALALIITGFIAAVWYWNERVRQVPLEEFGLADVKRVLDWEPEGKRRQIMERGWMTSHEWTSMNRRQAQLIDAKLKRRGAEQGDDPHL